MCGIVGMLSNSGMKWYSQKKDWIKTALYLDTLRGEHSTGIYVGGSKNENKESIYKKAMPGFDFVQMSKAIDLINDIDDHNVIIGHNRYATYGPVNMYNAHPYEEGSIRLVHNGTLQDTHSMPKRQTDSASICALLSHTSSKKVIEDLRGSFALVWYDLDHKKTFFARNKERPLWYATAEQGTVFLFASEYWTINVAAEKSNLDLDLDKDKHSMFSFDSGKIYSLDPEEDDYRGKLKYKNFNEYIIPKSLVPFTGTGGGRNTSGYTSPSGSQKDKKEKLEFLKGHGYEMFQYLQFIITDLVHRGVIDGENKYLVEGVADSIEKEHVSIDVKSHWNSKNEESEWAAQGYICDVQKEKGNFFLIVKDLKYLSDYKPPTDWYDYKNEHLYKAFDNQHVFKDRFEKLVEEGCAHCTTPIYPDDDTSIGWTTDNKPICTDCCCILEGSSTMKEYPEHESFSSNSS